MQGGARPGERPLLCFCRWPGIRGPPYVTTGAFPSPVGAWGKGRPAGQGWEEKREERGGERRACPTGKLLCSVSFWASVLWYHEPGENASGTVLVFSGRFPTSSKNRPQGAFSAGRLAAPTTAFCSRPRLAGFPFPLPLPLSLLTSDS